jgi:hypothetical protein
MECSKSGDQDLTKAFFSSVSAQKKNKKRSPPEWHRSTPVYVFGFAAAAHSVFLPW